MRTIGIDIGTTSVSGVVYDETTGVLDSITREHHGFIETPNIWEKIQNVTVLTDTAKEILDSLLSRHDGIARIGLTGQMHGVVYLDAEGHAVSPLYTWQDGRGAERFGGLSVVDQINSDGDAAVSSGYGLVTHIFNVNYDCCPFEAVSFATIMDYFGMVLTGRKTPLVHYSNAAGFGFWDPVKNCFDTERLQRYGAVPEILPEVTGKIEILGKYKGIPVTCAIGDNQASYLGSVGFEEGAILLNMGTGGQVSVRCGEYREIKGIDTRPFLDGEYLLVGASLCGGRAYAVLEKFLREYVREATGIDCEQYSVMERLAEQASSDSLFVCTELNGNRMDAGKRGSITGISEGNMNAGSLIRAYEEGMIRELLEFYQRMGYRAKRLYGAGNGLRKNRLLQEIAGELFEMELALSSNTEEAACGAAMSTLKAVAPSNLVKL